MSPRKVGRPVTMWTRAVAAKILRNRPRGASPATSRPCRMRLSFRGNSFPNGSMRRKKERMTASISEINSAAVKTLRLLFHSSGYAIRARMNTGPKLSPMIQRSFAACGKTNETVEETDPSMAVALTNTSDRVAEEAREISEEGETRRGGKGKRRENSRTRE